MGAQLAFSQARLFYEPEALEAAMLLCRRRLKRVLLLRNAGRPPAIYHAYRSKEVLTLIAESGVV